MALFDNTQEKQRKQNLMELENKRLAFARRLQEMGVQSDRAIYAQAGGGFHGIAISGAQICYITGPAPGEDADFTVQVYPRVAINTEEILIPSEGMGGILGFGKRGGIGYKLNFVFPDGSVGDLEIISGLNCIFEHDKGGDPLFDAKRRRGDANFVWEFRPVDQSRVKQVVGKWLQSLGDQL